MLLPSFILDSCRCQSPLLHQQLKVQPLQMLKDFMTPKTIIHKNKHGNLCHYLWLPNMCTQLEHEHGEIEMCMTIVFWDCRVSGAHFGFGNDRINLCKASHCYKLISSTSGFLKAISHITQMQSQGRYWIMSNSQSWLLVECTCAIQVCKHLLFHIQTKHF